MSSSATPFLIEGCNVRGTCVDMDAGADTMLAHRSYAPAVQTLVGEASAAAALLSATLQYQGRLSLQFQGQTGPLKLLVAQADSDLNVRAMAKTKGEAGDQPGLLLQGGVLGLTMDPEQGGQSYQAVVQPRGDSLALSLEGYFLESEQTHTGIRLAAGAERVAGLLIQRLPEDRGTAEAGWSHISERFQTLAPDCFLDAPPMQVLLQLYANEGVRVFPERAVQLRCRCSHASISAMLVALGTEEVESILADRGAVEVTCEFCGREWRYGADEIQRLVQALQTSTGDGPVH